MDARGHQRSYAAVDEPTTLPFPSHAGIGFLTFIATLVLFCCSTRQPTKETHRKTKLDMTLIGVVNPRLKENTFDRTSAGFSALSIAILAVIVLVLMVFVLHGQCTKVCGTFQLPLIDLKDNSECVVLGLTNDMPTFDGVTAGGSLLSTVSFGKCSLLHTQECAISSWGDLTTCATAFNTWVTSAPSVDFTQWTTLMVRANTGSSGVCAVQNLP